MTNAIDDAGRRDRHRRELDRQHDEARRTEQHDVEHRQDAYSRVREPTVDVALEPVVGRSFTVLAQRLLVLRFGPVQLSPFEDDLSEAEDQRTVRIALLLAMSMVLAMNGHPFLGWGAGAEPQPKAEEVTQRRMQIDRAMRLISMKPKGDAHHRDVRPKKGHDDVTPQAQIEHAIAIGI
jgi:hypothetical protein